jgi:cytochrome c oxidase assembly factor CtaG
MHREGNLGKALGAARLLSFCAGMLTLVLALLSPLDTLAARMFSAHMVQHLLLMMVAPPLLVWSRPTLAWLWAFPLPERRGIGRWWATSPRLQSLYAFLMLPLTVWLLASLALWFWHIPGMYDWALANDFVHAIEHGCFFLTSLAFWTLVMAPYGERNTRHGVAMIAVVTFALHSGILGALLTFAAAPLYQVHGTPPFSLTPLEDQQLAGLIMWIPASLVYVGVFSWLFVRWLEKADRTSWKATS